MNQTHGNKMAGGDACMIHLLGTTLAFRPIPTIGYGCDNPILVSTNITRSIGACIGWMRVKTCILMSCRVMDSNACWCHSRLV
jgi:hypothetical protein